ncbi:MAG TPA: hypothetical protein VIF60_07990 [Burkholderiaceae bacterium]
MRRLILMLLFFSISSANATSMAPPPLDELVDFSSDIAVAKIVTFVGYRANGELVTRGDLTTGCCYHNSISAVVLVSERLVGNHLKVGAKLEIKLSTIANMTLSGMQEFFTGQDVIIFLRDTPKGLNSISDGLTFTDELPSVKKLISQRNVQ